MPRKSNYSAEETKKAIKKTFMELYRIKSFDKITIGELAGTAHVNRSTFYYYFEDIYDLVYQIEQDFLFTVQQTFPYIISGILNRNFNDHPTVLIDFYQKYQKELLLFLVEKPNPKVIQTIKNYAKEYALGLMGLSLEHLTLRQKLITEYIANAQLGLIGWWLQNGQECSVEELGQLISKVNMEGPFPTLLESIDQQRSYV